MPTIASILAAGETRTSDEFVEGLVLDDPWVSSGADPDGDHLDVLLHRADGSVARVRVWGENAQTVAGRVARGDRVRGRVRERLQGEGVVVVESLRVV